MPSLASEKYENLAKAWDAVGRPPELLLTGDWGVLTMLCWLRSRGAQVDGVSPLLLAYGEDCNKAKANQWPHWLENMLVERDDCNRCGGRWMLNNFWFCTGCSGSCYCFECYSDNDKGANGNLSHSCGGDLVNWIG